MKRTLMATPTVRVDLARFEPGEHHARHRDRQSRITFVLQGAFCEETGTGATRLAAGDILFKSYCALHEDRFGEDGARVASFVFEDDCYEAAHASPWRVARDRATLRSAVIALESAAARDGAVLNTAATDLLAQQEERASRAAPRWLTRLKDALEAASLANVDIASEARAAGVHPAHASRLFRRCFGASITEHAQTHCVRRALARLAEPHATLSEIALATGFYDQSHMTRVFRRVTGLTPGAHRTLLAAAG